MSRSLARLIIVLAGLVLALGAAPEAQAGGKVDWSQYLEKPGDRLPTTRTPRAEPAKPGKRVTKAAKRPAKARAGKAKRTPKRRR